jgi:hypothetical protein
MQVPPAAEFSFLSLKHEARCAASFHRLNDVFLAPEAAKSVLCYTPNLVRTKLSRGIGALCCIALLTAVHTASAENMSRMPKSVDVRLPPGISSELADFCMYVGKLLLKAWNNPVALHPARPAITSRRRGGGGGGGANRTEDSGNRNVSSENRSSEISLIAPTIGTFSNVSKFFGDPSFTLTAPTSNSAGAFTYVSGNTAVATIIGSTVTIVGGGTSVITATQAANGIYSSGIKTMTLTVFAIDACLSEPCLNGGTCHSPGDGSYTCTCEEGFAGTICELDGANCAADTDNACLNGGECVPTAAHGECFCTECFTGAQCDTYICT